VSGWIRSYPQPGRRSRTLTRISTSRPQQCQRLRRLNDFSKPVILIIKKNVTTLDGAAHLVEGELNAEGDGRIADVPMLVIDDEADNASINTNKAGSRPDRGPMRGSGRCPGAVRQESCYVGYTATPFANIFIDPDAYRR
jgi:hypothetical protein